MTRETAEPFPAVEIEPDRPARHAVIWLHGLGADGHDFVPIVPELRLDPELAVRWVFPHAPSIPVTINGGFVMPAWYDIRSLDFHQRHDEEGIRRSAELVTRLIERETARGVPAARVVLAGFSQGGAIALHTGLRHPEGLAGIIALSTYLVLHERLEAERSAANAGVPIFQAHGTLDTMVAPDRGAASRDWLQRLGYSVEWHEYPMAHQVCQPEIEDVSRWLGGVLARGER